MKITKKIDEISIDYKFTSATAYIINASVVYRSLSIKHYFIPIFTGGHSE